MIRLNRSRFLGIVCVLVFVYFLVFTDSGSSASQFRANTEAGLARRRQREQDLPLRGHLSDEDLTKKTNDELQGILSSQSREGMKKDEHGNPLGRVYRDPQHEAPGRVNSEEASLIRDDTLMRNRAGDSEGKKSHDVSDVDSSLPDYQKSAVKSNTDGATREKPLKTDTDEESDPGREFALGKLDEYLKSPVVIFSKSYCPHSRRAKQLLLDIYQISPKPVVVELDLLGEHIPSSSQHGSSSSSDHEELSKKTLGKALQDLLGERTGRKTVPNIVVGGEHSIGGNDNIWEMHESGTLAEEIKKFGGRRVISVDVKDSEDDEAK